jgi:beta-galactosidase
VVWLNGTLVGVSKDSRLPAEWEVTGLLVPGDNLLAALVLRWSDATYLEDQDMWRLSGLHRDVHLAKVPAAASISDIRVKTPLNFSSSSSSRSINCGCDDWPVLEGAKLEVEVFLEVQEQQGVGAEGTRVTPVTRRAPGAAAVGRDRGGVGLNDGGGGWCYDVKIDLMTSQGEVLMGGVTCQVEKVRGIQGSEKGGRRTAREEGQRVGWRGGGGAFFCPGQRVWPGNLHGQNKMFWVTVPLGFCLTPCLTRLSWTMEGSWLGSCLCFN